jgi:hypothetical protein
MLSGSAHQSRALNALTHNHDLRLAPSARACAHNRLPRACSRPCCAQGAARCAVGGRHALSKLRTQHLSTQHSAPSTKHPALSTSAPQHSAPSTHHLSTQHSALSTQHSALSTSALSTSALSTQHSALSTQHAPSTQHSALSTHPALSTPHSALSIAEWARRLLLLCEHKPPGAPAAHAGCMHQATVWSYAIVPIPLL